MEKKPPRPLRPLKQVEKVEPKSLDSMKAKLNEMGLNKKESFTSIDGTSEAISLNLTNKETKKIKTIRSRKMDPRFK